MKKLGLVIATSLSMFLVACEEEVSSSVVISCDMPEQKLCSEYPAASVSEEKQKECTEEGGTLGAGCPGGAELSCTFTDDGLTGEGYFYDKTQIDMFKALLGAESDEDLCKALNESE